MPEKLQTQTDLIRKRLTSIEGDTEDLRQMADGGNNLNISTQESLKKAIRRLRSELNHLEDVLEGEKEL